MRNALLPLITLALFGCGGSDSGDPNATKTPLISLSFNDVRFAECIATEAVYNEIEYVEDLHQLNCTGTGITSVWGLDQLTSLTSLELGYNQLTEIDASNLSKLERLNVEANALTQVSLPDGERLTHLNLGENDLTTLDLTGLKDLTEFTAAHNPLTRIDWRSEYTKLSRINISNTQLRSMDLTIAPNLFSFAAEDSQLDMMISSTMAKLDTLRLYNTEINLELSHFPNVKLMSLVPTSSHVDLSYNPELSYLSLDGDKLQTLDVSALTKLSYLTVWAKNVTQIDISNNVDLTHLTLGYLSLNDLNIDNQNKLEEVNISSATLPNATITYLRNQSTIKGFTLVE